MLVAMLLEMSMVMLMEMFVAMLAAMLVVMFVAMLMEMLMDIEINFCSDSETFVVKSITVPQVGSVINIRKVDYRVTEVYWSLDYADHDLRDRKLRATVDIKEIEHE